MSERREFWIVPDESHPEDFDDQYFGDALLSHPRQGPLMWQESLVHVVEIKPGEIVISREKLLQAFGQAYCSDKNARKVLDSEVGIELARILFN